jgi:hypothetical protein
MAVSTLRAPVSALAESALCAPARALAARRAFIRQTSSAAHCSRAATGTVWLIPGPAEKAGRGRAGAPGAADVGPGAGGTGPPKTGGFGWPIGGGCIVGRGRSGWAGCRGPSERRWGLLGRRSGCRCRGGGARLGCWGGGFTLCCPWRRSNWPFMCCVCAVGGWGCEVCGMGAGHNNHYFPSIVLSISAGNFICLEAYELHSFFNPQKFSRVGLELCEAVRAVPEQEPIE